MLTMLCSCTIKSDKKMGQKELDKIKTEYEEYLFHSVITDSNGNNFKIFETGTRYIQQSYYSLRSLTVVCPDGCVIFELTAKPLGNENFHTGGFWDYPDETQKQ